MPTKLILRKIVVFGDLVYDLDRLHAFAALLRGSSPRKSAESAIFLFLQKKGLYMWVDHVPKYYEASSTINLLNGGFYIIYIYM